MRRKTRTKIQKIFQTKILLENIRVSDFIDADFIDTNIVTEVNNSIQDSSHSIDFAVTDSNKINIIKTISDGFETMPVKSFTDPKDIINQVREINTMNIFPTNQQNSQRDHQTLLPHNQIHLSHKQN